MFLCKKWMARATRGASQRVWKFVGKQYQKFSGLALGSLFFRLVSIVLNLLPALYYKDIINLLSSVEGLKSEVAQHALALLGIVFWIK